MEKIITSRSDLRKIIFETVLDVFQINDLKNETRQKRLNYRTTLSLSEVSTITGLSKGTLYSKVTNGAIPFSRDGGRLVFYEDELYTWLKKRKSKKEVAHG